VTLSTVRVGVIGLGAFGETRVAALSGLVGVEVGAVCSRRAEHAAEVASRYGVPRCYTDWGELARDPLLDAVVVATAEHEHLQPALAAIQAGKHLLIEKPLATAPADAHRIASAATSAGAILMPGHTVRFETRYTLLKEHLASGALGDVVAVQARRNRARKAMQPYLRLNPIFETVVHDLDVALWYVGRRVQSVVGWQRSVQDADNPDLVWLALEFGGGVLGFLQTHWLVPDEAGVGVDDAFEVVGSRGVARLQLTDPGFFYWDERGNHVPDVAYEPRLRCTVGGAVREELTYFTSCVRDGRPAALVSTEDAVHGIEVATAAQQACRTGQAIRVPEYA
jgi:UDP-N-acetylglucosamine 3-dehydrogenase